MSSVRSILWHIPWVVSSHSHSRPRTRIPSRPSHSWHRLVFITPILFECLVLIALLYENENIRAPYYKLNGYGGVLLRSFLLKLWVLLVVFELWTNLLTRFALEKRNARNVTNNAYVFCFLLFLWNACVSRTSWHQRTNWRHRMHFGNLRLGEYGRL